MRIVMTRGCVCDGLEIDEKNIIDLTDKERLEVIDKLGEYLKKEPQNLEWVLNAILPQIGEYEDLGECEVCGDYIEQYTLNI